MDLSDFKNYLDAMKDENLIATVFGLKKERHKKILINDNEEELDNKVKDYSKIKGFTKL